jgi:hypothetical protein
MARTPEEITAKAGEIYDFAKPSSTPLVVASFASMNLLKEDGWQPVDVEKVIERIMDLLIQHGWNRQPDRTGE